jgi:hypothetical protein
MMQLEQIAGSPGRWVNHDWQVGKAGAFALVAGVNE